MSWVTIQAVLILVCGEAIASHLQSVLHKHQTWGARRYVAVLTASMMLTVPSSSSSSSNKTGDALSVALVV
jgi:hypothetical protein